MAEEERLLEVIGGTNQGVLAGVTRAGYPHLTNVLYAWDAAERVARISTTATRVKGRIFRRNPHGALHVSGPHFWSYAVGEGDVETSDVATEPGDEASRELFEVASNFYPELDEAKFVRRMVEERRLVLRLRVNRLYGLVRDEPPG
jgi:PPOX class probable F420-dependent enzyme